MLGAERAGFDAVLFAQHTINPESQDEEILEAWTAAAALAALTERIEIIAGAFADGNGTGTSGGLDHRARDGRPRRWRGVIVNIIK